MSVIVLVLAAALVGPPAPPDHAAEHREIERVADGTAADGFRLVGGAVLDLGTTEWCLHRNPNCRETNPLGWNGNMMGVTKTGFVALSWFGCYKLRRDGNHKTATILSWAAFGIQALAAANNTRNALRER